MLVRENMRAIRHLDAPHEEKLLHTMAETHLEGHVLPAATAQLGAMDIRVCQP